MRDSSRTAIQSGGIALSDSGYGASYSAAIRKWIAAPIGRASSLTLSELRGSISARVEGLRHSHVDELVQCPDTLPPIVVHRATMRVIDGVHRVAAAKRRGRKVLEAIYFDGTEEEAFALSVRLNATHGLPLSLADRKAAAQRILMRNGGWSDRFIATVVGLSHGTVAEIRRSTGRIGHSNEGRLGRDGKVRPLDPVGGRLRAAEELSKNPAITLRELARAAGISISTAREVRIRLEEGLDPVPDGLRQARRQAPVKSDKGEAGPISGVSGESACTPAVPVSDPVSSSDPSRQARSETTTPRAADGRRPIEENVNRNDVAEAYAEIGAITDVHLELLRKDPAIRLSHAGRNLVRQLGDILGALAQCHQLLDAVPAHCVGTVSEIARTISDASRSLADTVEHRGNSGDQRLHSV